MKSHPWYSIALIVLGAYALLSIAYQVFDWHLLGARRFQAQWLPEISIPNSSDNLTLKVRSPDRLAFDKPGMPGSQISIQLRAMQPVTRPLTYTVSVEPITGEVTFADKDGVLISPRADLVAGLAAQESATWFLRWTPRDLWHSDTMTLTLRVFDSKDEALYSPLVSREIPIALESPYSVSVLVRILDMLLGSNAPQIGVAGLLVVLFFGLLKTQKDERQKRRQRRLSDEIIALDAHWSNNTRAAVDRYIYLSEETTDEVELQGRMSRLWESGWRERVLDQAFEAYIDNDDIHASSFAEFVKHGRTGNKAERLLPEIDGAEKTAQSEASHLLALLQPAQKSTREPCVQLNAIIALATSRGIRLADRLVPHLLTLLPPIANPPALERIGYLGTLIASGKLHPRWLLLDTRARARLKQLESNKALGEYRFILDQLDDDRTYSWSGLPFCAELAEEPPGDYDIKQALLRLGWSKNPFGPDRVEDDSEDRFQAYVFPELPLWKSLENNRSFVFSAQSGSGQTSVLWKVMEEWQKSTSRRVFPVLVDAQSLLASSTPCACYQALSYDIVQAFLPFFVLNPGSFASLRYAQQRAIARLISAQRLRQGDLISYCRATGLSESLEEVKRFFKMLTDAGYDTYPSTIDEPAEQLSLLADAHMPDFGTFALIFDVSYRNLEQYGPDLLASRLNLILGTVNDLAGARLILKAGVPLEIADRLMMPLIPLHWPDTELKSILMHRFRFSMSFAERSAGSWPSLEELLFGSLGPKWRSQVTDQIIEAAQGSPRRLVNICNELLRRYGKKPKRELLADGDLESVISHF